MTPNDIVDAVLDEIERPDLATMAQIRLQQSIYETHAIAFFDRDKTYLDTPVVPGQSYLNITRPARFRKLACIQALDSAGNVVFEAFKDKGLKKEVTNYFGFQEVNTYRISGNTIRVDFSPSLGVDYANVRVWYWEFPTYSVTGGTIGSSSWICTEFSGVIIADLALRLSGATDDDTAFQKQRIAREEGRDFLLHNYPTDVPLE